MDNLDKTTFSLDDDEIVEEEVTERDEEYDDGYEDEEYDDDYGDEYDDEYDDEEGYDEDGYNDDYYDDRLNKVLDEIAEIKRGMVPAAQQQMPTPLMPPQYIYQPTAPPAGSEVVMYNEISRLRDELAKNQSSLEMQKELTRMKEDMARDQRFAESQYNAEIKRLQAKIEELQKNALSPQDELSGPQDQARLEGGRNNANALNFDKLLSINESILMATRDSDARIQNEISQLKRQLEDIPSLKELNGAVSAVRKAAHNAEGMSAESLNRLSGDISALRALIEDKGIPAAPVQTQAAGGAAVVPADIDSSELLRQLYDIKAVLGSASAAAVKRTQVLADLIADFKKVKFDVNSQAVPFKEKLASAYNFVKKLTDSNEPDAIDIVEATNELLVELAAKPITRANFADVASYCQDNGITNVTSAMRESADRFFNLCDKLANMPVEAYGDHLIDMLAEINTLQNDRRRAENSELVGQIVNAIAEEPRDGDLIADLYARFVDVRIGDVFDLPSIEVPKNYRPAHTPNDENIFNKLADIKSAVLDSAAVAQVAAEERARQSEEPADDGSKQALEELTASVQELKAQLSAATGTDNVSDALAEIREQYIDLSGRVVDIAENIQAPVEADGSTPVMSIADKTQMLDDIQYIRNKLDDYALFNERIDELKQDILNIGTTLDLTAVTDRIAATVGEVNDVIDRLYEDISNVILASESNIIAHFDEAALSAESLENAKADILADAQLGRDAIVAEIQLDRDAVLADLQNVKDALAAMGEGGGNAQLNEAVEALRADFLNFAETASANSDAAALDRQRLLDDVAFLREQAELALGDEQQADAYAQDAAQDEGSEADAETDKLFAMLDDISAKVALTAALGEEVEATKAGVNELAGNVGAVTENVAAVNDSLVAVNDGVSSLNENFTSLNDAVRTISDDVASTLDAATATLDALGPISEQINSILDKLDRGATAAERKVEEETVTETSSRPALADEELIELKDSLNTILDTLPLFPQADDVIIARDNTYSILDQLTLMPQADEVTTTRDTVLAIQEAVNALTDSINTAVVDAQGLPVSDAIAQLRESVDATAEDVRAIRETLGDGTQKTPEEVAKLLEQVAQVLDKLEKFETTAVANKEDILDAVSAIKEEIHINNLDETMSAAGIDNETREALVGEIAEVRERLGSIESSTQQLSDGQTSALEGIDSRLADLQAIFEDKLITITDQQALLDEKIEASKQSSALDGDGMQTLLEELNIIKENLAAQSEYDTVEEILSLREDLKAARIVDQDDVSGELEAVKNELAAISSGNILDEIRALREDIANLSVGGDGGAPEPTDSEINLVLNEIVSLRDEVFSFKDEVLNATALKDPQVTQTKPETPADDINSVLDELTSLREDQAIIADSIDELKDIVSRRTAEKAETQTESVEGEGVMGEEAVATPASSEELSLILDEIVNLKNDIDRIEAGLGGDRLAEISAQVEAIRAAIDGAGVPRSETVVTADGTAEPVAVDLSPIMDQLDVVNTALDELIMSRQDEQEAQNNSEATLADRMEELHDEIADIKATVMSIAGPVDYSQEIEQLREELNRLREENEQLKQNNAEELNAQIAELKNEIHDMSLSVVSGTGDPADGTSYAALIEEIKGLREQVAAQQAASAVDPQLLEEIAALRGQVELWQNAPQAGEAVAAEPGLVREIAALREQLESRPAAPATFDEATLAELRELLAEQRETAGLGTALGEIRDEIAQLRSLTTVANESGGGAEVTAIRDEIAALKAMIASPDSIFGVAEDVTTIKADVQTLKDEPDLGVMSEILALRDEFQALREQIEEVKRIAGETEKSSDDSLLNEIQSLRDQLFAISMANVSDSSSGESNYESYNNIILDELAAIRDQMAVGGSTADLAAVSEDIAGLKEELESRENLLEELSRRIDSLGDGREDTRILNELASLRADMANQRDADLTTLNFMSEMAHLLERQNQYLTQNSGAKVTDEIQKLKEEIASSDAVAEEVAKLREIMTQSGSASDNETILNELADLREELSREKPSSENALILDAISRLRDEITVLAEREKVRDIDRDEDLSDSLSDLKDQLNEIAGIMEPGEKTASAADRATASEKPAPKKRGRKPAAKSAPAAKKGAKKGTKSKKPAPNELDDKITEQVRLMGADGGMALDPNAASEDDLDVADRLAKQVANKLIMEQLVEQLGDNNVSEDRVNEILRDILPQEFTTIAMNEASDKVRHLANELVLDKLRERLNGKKPDNR